MKFKNILAAALSALTLYSANVSAAPPEPKKAGTGVETKIPAQEPKPTGTSVSTWTPTIKDERTVYVLHAGREEVYCDKDTPQECEDEYRPTLCIGKECQGNKTTIEPAYHLRLTGGFLLKFDHDKNGLAENPKGAYVSLSVQPRDKRFYFGGELSVAGDSETKTKTIANGLGEQRREKDLIDLALTGHFGYELFKPLNLTLEAGLAVSLANEKLTEIGRSKYWDDTLTSGGKNTKVRGVFSGKIGASISDFLLEAGAGFETDGTERGTVPYFKAGVGIKGL